MTPEVMELVQSEVKGPKAFIEISNIAGIEKRTLLFGVDETHYSSLRKLLRVSVYVMRFIKHRFWDRISEKNQRKFLHHNLLADIFNNLNHGCITPFEISVVSVLWVYFIQHRRYKDVYVAIEKKRKHCLQKQLGLEIDKYGVLRCHGRYNYADLTEETKIPKLLPRYEHFTKLLIEEVHQRLVHAGVSHTLSQVRQAYWIPQGRAEIRRVLSKCTICKRHNGPPFRLPNMPPWPKERMCKSLPFQYVGLDYLGPLRVKEGGAIQKMWICLYTCLTIRAVHLELIRGLSAQQFLDCLKRFVARRGRPLLIISDNAPQFRLVKTVLDQQWNKVFNDNNVLSFF